MLKDSATRYGSVTVFLHWSIVILFIILVSIGLWMDYLPKGDDKWWWYGVHKSFGLTVFVLIVIRIFWRSSNPTPNMPENMLKIEVFLAKAVHALLYAIMLIMPISGYIDSCAGDYHLAFFDLFEIPKIFDKNEALEEISVMVHHYTAILLGVAVSLHIVGALKHHFIVKDDTLLRMLPEKKGD
ncbi:MAG: cytochrome b [Methylococcales bacterium]|jgi:cytochrome b561|nr:cytochrome b [Methylococcales bacterium]MBT7409648.1 cytochrome b [Methylococcales bacterium]